MVMIVEVTVVNLYPLLQAKTKNNSPLNAIDKSISESCCLELVFIPNLQLHYCFRVSDVSDGSQCTGQTEIQHNDILSFNLAS